MFNKNSVFFTLTIGFVISLLLVFITFFAVVQKDRTLEFKNTKDRYATIGQIVNQEYDRFGFTNNLRIILDDMGLILIEDQKEIDKLINQKRIELLLQKRSKHFLIHIFTNHKDNYLHMQTPFDEFMIIDPEINCEDNFNRTIAIFIMLLLTIIFIFYTIYKKLEPLNELKSKIDSIGDKDMKLDFLKDGANDEVSLLAKELIDKSNDINNLKEARNIFIRNIMHELKTPITKGRFLAELPNDEANNEKLKKVFFQLESLINEFAAIEEIIAKNKTIDKQDIFFDDVLENALDLLMYDLEDVIDINQNALKLNVNFKLFTIVVKNFIDNGVKYSQSKRVDINVQEDFISFANDGEKLKHNLENYYEPFFDNAGNANDSFGLGLYIIKSILDVHNYKLEYKYKDGKNIFIIIF